MCFYLKKYGTLIVSSVIGKENSSVFSCTLTRPVEDEPASVLLLEINFQTTSSVCNKKNRGSPFKTNTFILPLAFVKCSLLFQMHRGRYLHHRFIYCIHVNMRPPVLCYWASMRLLSRVLLCFRMPLNILL